MKFLVDEKILEHEIGKFKREAVADSFMACYDYTCWLKKQKSTNSLRLCFNLLIYFDLVQLISLNGSGKVGCNMIKDIEAVLGPVFEQNGGKKKEAIANITQWSLFGAKLSQLCDHFGAGYLSFLGDQLTPRL